ncbi:MAG: hybrid sensor histidine kinase/response regulator [Gemmatimonadota bacterium]
MRLRSHLHVLTIGTLLPVIVFGLTATAVIAERERDLLQRGAADRNRALLTAVDAELDGYLESLQALAGSSALAQDDLGGFHAEAVRALRIQPGWQNIKLALPDGQVVLDATVPFGIPLKPVRERPSFESVVTAGRPAFRDLFEEDDGTFLFGVRTPVESDGRLRYVLSALVAPSEISSLLDRQKLPSDWTGVVLDSDDRIVARTIDQNTMVGKLAAVSLRDALRESPEGLSLGRTLEGTRVYTPYHRSPSTGWTVAIGIPAAQVEAGVAGVGWIFALGIMAAVLAAILLANVLSRRIVAPIAALETAARALGRGEPVRPPEATGVREVAEVSRILRQASEAVREREAALRTADQAKDEFLAMLGHELRNPLSALTSAADILEKFGAPDGPAHRAADVIDRQVRHMTRLVDDLLDVSRVTTGKINLEKGPVDLGHAVRSVVRMFEAAGRLEHHEVTLDIRPVWVHADASRIEQIVSNLVGNAIKYTPADGRIAVRVDQQGPRAVLEVADTGAGLDPDLVPRVFDLFVQGERALDREAGGLGLGLTLVKSLVERHGGTVQAFSAGRDRGARFTVRLPAIEPPAVSRDPDVAEEALRVDGKLRVLIIEDNVDARETLTVALEFMGHDVLVASDGEAGLVLAREEHPDVAVIDIGLPRIDGFEVARRLRADESASDIRLVALTGYSQEETRARAEAAGFDRFLTKPVGVKELARVIDGVLAAPRG